MSNVEMSSQLVSQAVVNSKRSSVEGKACQTGCNVHLLSRMGIVSIQVSTKKEGSADLNGFLGKCCGELCALRADISFHRMGENVHSRISGDCRRNRTGELCI